MVVLYPKMGTAGATHQEHSGCWDGYGQTGADYAERGGAQMKTISNMLTAIMGAK